MNVVMDTDGRSQARDAQNAVDSVVEQMAGYQLKRSYMIIHHAAQQALDPLGLRVVSLTALSLIVDNPGIAPSQIADALEMERSNIVVIIDELETRQLISRTRSEEDRRRFALNATIRGRQLRDQAAQVVTQAEGRTLAGLNSDEKAQLLALLGRVRSGVAKADS